MSKSKTTYKERLKRFGKDEKKFRPGAAVETKKDILAQFEKRLGEIDARARRNKPKIHPTSKHITKGK